MKDTLKDSLTAYFAAYLIGLLAAYTPSALQQAYDVISSLLRNLPT